MTVQRATIRQAVDALRERGATVPGPSRTTEATSAAREFTGALKRSETEPRTYVAALKVLESLATERRHLAEQQARERRSAQAQAAGRARAAQVADLDVPAVRAWARAQGIPVPDRGRYLPPEVITAWRAAQLDQPGSAAG